MHFRLRSVIVCARAASPVLGPVWRRTRRRAMDDGAPLGGTVVQLNVTSFRKKNDHEDPTKKVIAQEQKQGRTPRPRCTDYSVTPS
jgi:hypothetical protein